MTDKRLNSFADRLDRLEDERKELGGDIKDVYAEVKSAGYNVKALRKVLAERRKKTDAELEADIELYRAQLSAPGASLRTVAAQNGISKSKLQRLVPKNTNGTGDQNAASQGVASPPAPQTPEGDTSVVTPAPDGGAGTGTTIFAESANNESCGASCGAQSGERENASPQRFESASANGTPPGVAPGPHDTYQRHLDDFRRSPDPGPMRALAQLSADPVGEARPNPLPISDAQALANLDVAEALFFASRARAEA